MQELSGIFLQMQQHGMRVPQFAPTFKIKSAADQIKEVANYVLKQKSKNLIWLPEYDEIGEYLSDTKGKGLLLYGQCGLGKTFMSRYVIPAIILSETNQVIYSWDAVELTKKTGENLNIDIALKKKLISIDDIGTEEMIVDFGKRRCGVSELIDASEKYGKVLFLTTNLTGDELKLRYGDRIYDRILEITKRIAFKGKSFRNKV